MAMQIGFVMDPIGSIKPRKDSTLAMMLAAQRRGWQLWYLEPRDLALGDAGASARVRPVEVMDDPQCWYRLGEVEEAPLSRFDVLLMRKDPPFDLDYVFATYILERAEQDGCLVVNRPRSLRDLNEKVFITAFPDCAPPTLISADAGAIRAFHARHREMVLKPLDGMGGASVFRVGPTDPNLSVILETLTDRGRRYCMAQAYLPEISDGDKRVLMVDGEPVPYCLARIPAAGETRGNLAAGATADPRPLGPAERRIATRVGPALRERGILFAGLDVIGDRLTEINVTSPTCIRELDAAFGLDIAGQLLDAIAARRGGRGG